MRSASPSIKRHGFHLSVTLAGQETSSLIESEAHTIRVVGVVVVVRVAVVVHIQEVRDSVVRRIRRPLPPVRPGSA